jgi:hypothetical protein
MTNEIDAQRGQQAQAVLDNPIYQDAYAKLEESLVGKWKESRSLDEREECHRFLVILQKVHAALDSTMRSGQLAQAEINRKRKLAEKLFPQRGR